MIRKFVSVVIFTVTVGLASFGQDVFGRNDIIHWAHQVQAQGPKQAAIAWEKTDAALAQLAPEAGSGLQSVCNIDNLEWVLRIHNS